MSSFIKHIIVLLLLCISWGGYGQQENDPVDERWKQMNERIQYFPSKNPDGPSNRYNYPPSMSEGGTPTNSGNGFGQVQPSDEDIRYSREQRYPNSGSGNGVKKRIKDADKEDLEDLSTPDAEVPDFDAPDFDPDIDLEGSATFWKYLFIIIGVLLLAYVIYQLFFKGKQVKDESVTPTDYHDDELDPSTLQKSQLELDLEEAITEEDYRLAVRILYTMILKQLVEKKWIAWEKKKTNYHYLLELGQRPERSDFDKSIRIFEWVWYGKNNPNKEEFKAVNDFYNRFLKSLSIE